MFCSKCAGEAIYNGTEVETIKIEEVGATWPIKILCQCETTYQCSDCKTLITETETRDYIPSKS